MARVALPITRLYRGEPVSAAGLYIDASVDGHYVPANDGNAWLEIENSNTGGTVTVTVPATETFAGQALAPTVFTVPAKTTVKDGPYPPVLFNRDDDSVWVNVVAAGGADLAQVKLAALGI